MRQKIIKISDGKFKIFWDDSRYEKDTIILDFNPIINNFNLDRFTDFCLLHWQARPRGLRRWGIYHRANDDYRGADWDRLTFDCCNIELLQMNELNMILPPSAVVLLPNHCLKTTGEIIKCEAINELATDNRTNLNNFSTAISMVATEAL